MLRKREFGETALKTITSGVGQLKDAALWLQSLAWGGIGAASAAAGYGLARLTSPVSVAKNTDKELEAEALKTEIDVTLRRIAALEERRRKRAAGGADKPKIYDRFV